jgi:dTDP-4-dehydrorhamnose 3,5-epimerase
MVDFERLSLKGVVLIRPRKFEDGRGSFSETFREDQWAAAIGETSFVQENHSCSRLPGTVRGLHFQRPPFAQGKLVRVTRGAALDVVVDARVGSPTYQQHLAIELSEENGHQLWVPRGFLHGFCTLTEKVDFIYKVDAYYAPSAEGSVAFDDPDLNIVWPVSRASAVLAPKDASAPMFKEVAPVFPMSTVATPVSGKAL